MVDHNFFILFEEKKCTHEWSKVKVAAPAAHKSGRCMVRSHGSRDELSVAIKPLKSADVQKELTVRASNGVTGQFELIKRFARRSRLEKSSH